MLIPKKELHELLFLEGHSLLFSEICHIFSCEFAIFFIVSL